MPFSHPLSPSSSSYSANYCPQIIDLDTFMNVTRTDTDYAKAFSLIKHDYNAYREFEFIHHLTITIDKLEEETRQQRAVADKIRESLLARANTREMREYLVDEIDRRTKRQE